MWDVWDVTALAGCASEGDECERLRYSMLQHFERASMRTRGKSSRRPIKKENEKGEEDKGKVKRKRETGIYPPNWIS